AGLRLMFGTSAEPVTSAEWTVAGVTLASMVAFNIWGPGLVRMLCALAGLDMRARVDWSGLPSLEYVSWSFERALVAPFVIACLAVAMKAVGTITVCQRMVDADWVRPNMVSATRGVLADGITTMLAGIAGAVGTNTS